MNNSNICNTGDREKLNVSTTVTVIDYGMGNLHSVMNALEKLGVDAIISSSSEDIRSAQKMILPGVGAFPDAMKALRENGLDSVIIEECKKGKPLLGICLGMQLLFESSEEFGHTEGLGLIPGRVIPIDGHGLKIPHIGWNSLTLNIESPLTASLSDGEHVYFVHSFRADTQMKNIIAYTEYGEMIPALVCADSIPVFGSQFHPEKSHSTGLSIIAAFCGL